MCQTDFSMISSPMPSHNEDSSCQLLNRKKRRGMIEKRRRDRINNSLLELRRLVPAAFEKQGSAKLEKAEILQMTVDHLRMLHAKGFDAFSFDPHKFAMDYHAIGFRECAGEVARYMVANEGLDLHDPLRVRLMSHLNNYASQRELALKASTGHTGWNPNAFTTPLFSSAQSNINSLTPISSDSMPLHGTAPVPYYSTSNTNSHQNHQNSVDGSNGSSIAGVPIMTQLSAVPKPSASPNPISSMAPLYYPPNSTSGVSHITSSTHQHSNPYFGYAPQPGVPTSSSGIPNQHPQSASVKHYRPWGVELAY